MARASSWQKARRADTAFSRALVKVARIVGRIVQQFGENHAAARRALEEYARIITPWAQYTAKSMVEDVSARDLAAWKANSQAIGAGLRNEVARTAVGARTIQLTNEGAKLIRSLPTEAAERVSKLSLEAMFDGARASEIQKEIMRTGQVTEGRARTIARTEVGRAASALTQARAESIGSTGYIWRTVGDSDVRPSHKKMNGKFVAWDNPPTLDGMTGHAGALPNCRCYAEPVIPD